MTASGVFLRELSLPFLVLRSTSAIRVAIIMTETTMAAIMAYIAPMGLVLLSSLGRRVIAAPGVAVIIEVGKQYVILMGVAIVKDHDKGTFDTCTT